MHKIVLAITGASGSIYPKLLLQRLLAIPDQWSELGVVMTTNAKQVWETELGNDAYKELLHDSDKVKVSAPWISMHHLRPDRGVSIQ